MKKSAIKKILSFLLTIIIAFSVMQTAFAENEAEPADETVAKIWVCSNMSIPLILGHTYVYVENLSDEPIKVGAYEVPVGEGVSVGCFAFSAYDGWGIYYNLEAYRENKKGKEGRIWSKSSNLTADELENMSDYIIGYLNHWDPIFNCSYFSYTVWNAATGDFLIPSPLPIIAHLMLMITGGEKGTLDMFFADESQVYRQRGMGDSSRLEPVCKATLNF
ncbi:MAG: hypothetical protein IJE72_00115 [Clostridia bacterium]|nr:hypothetical protein [Clostridia bacterium]